MKELVQSFYSWYRSTLRNAKYRWIIIAATLLYLVSPFDIAPDFIPVIGWIDDGVVATLLVTELSQIALEFLKKRQSTAKAEDPMNEPVVVEVME
jgi:uncharacterized membrane protein YkvA (DUF1232 family)